MRQFQRIRQAVGKADGFGLRRVCAALTGSRLGGGERDCVLNVAAPIDRIGTC